MTFTVFYWFSETKRNLASCYDCQKLYDFIKSNLCPINCIQCRNWVYLRFAFHTLLSLSCVIYSVVRKYQELIFTSVVYLHFLSDFKREKEEQGATLFIYSNFDYSYKKVQVGKDQEKAQSEKDSHSKNRGTNNQVLYTMKHIVSRMSSYFPNRWPLSYLNLTKNMKTYIRRQQHKKN